MSSSLWTDPHAVLDIARGSSETEIKAAYRRALLAHHPDKLKTNPDDGGSSSTKYTIDDINKAYQEIRRGEGLDLSESSTIPSGPVNFNEVVDLSDFVETERGNGSYEWTRGCRCGEAQGYTLLERDLELNGDADEIAVQCSGCSIWILVQYSVE